jgi:hypothetical protein
MRRLVPLLAVLAIAPPASAHDWPGIAADARDHLYVVDAEDGQVWSIDPKGAVKVHVPGEEDGKRCRHTHHLALDAAGVLWMPSG